jgi:hypothetical protein
LMPKLVGVAYNSGVGTSSSDRLSIACISSKDK